LELYDALQNAYFHRPIYTPLRPGEPVTGRYQLIIGNWRHGGGIDPGIELEWFDTWLKHINTGLPTGTRTPIHVEELGDNRWVNLADYPMTSRYAPWFLGAGGTLTRIAPAGPGADAIVWAPPAQSSVAYTTPALSRGATLAGPLDLTVYAQSSGSDIELMADLFDVAPDGTSRQISHGGELGSMRALDPAKSWTDAAGRPIRPYLALLNDDLLPAGRLFRYDIPIQPQVWLLAPGHRLRLRISGQPDPAACQAGFENVPWMVIGCKPRPAITALLVGDTFVIGRAKGAASYLNLPLLPYRYFRTIRSGITPTSRGVVLPLSW
jgi:predicted acyl esterase